MKKTWRNPYYIIVESNFIEISLYTKVFDYKSGKWTFFCREIKTSDFTNFNSKKMALSIIQEYRLDAKIIEIAGTWLYSFEEGESCTEELLKKILKGENLEGEEWKL